MGQCADAPRDRMLIAAILKGARLGSGYRRVAFSYESAKYCLAMANRNHIFRKLDMLEQGVDR